MGGSQSKRQAKAERKAQALLANGKRLKEEGKFKEAVRDLQKAVAMFMELHGGKDHEDIAKAMYQLGDAAVDWNTRDALDDLDAMRNSIELLENTATVQRRLLGSQNRDALSLTLSTTAIAKMGMWLRLDKDERGKLGKDALRCMEESWEVGGWTDDIPGAGNMLSILVRCAIIGDDEAAAVPYAQRAIAALLKTRTPDDPVVVDMQMTLDVILSGIAAKAKSSSAASACGVSLRHLDTFVREHGLLDGDFNGVCAKVKELTGGGSYADLLLKGEDKKSFVKEQADVFVSYAWKNNVGEVMKSLMATLQNEEDDMFIWMDVFIVNQHVASLGTMDFVKWTEVFGQTLSKIGKAFVMMLPALRPISSTRSWCIYEWYVLASNDVAYKNLVSQSDKDAFIQRILKHGMTTYEFRDVTSGINISNATAFKREDQEAILSIVETIGRIKVNDVVMKALKEFMLSLLDEAITAGNTPNEKLNAMVSKTELLWVLGEFEPARAVTGEIDDYVKLHSDEVSTRMKAVVLRNMVNKAVHAKDDLKKLELAQSKSGEQISKLVEEHKTDKREDLIAAIGGFMQEQGILAREREGELLIKNLELYEVVKGMFKDDEKELSTTLYDQGYHMWHNYSDRLDEALGYLQQAQAIQERVHGGRNHPDVARTMYEIASLTLFMNHTKSDFNAAEYKPRFEEVLSVQKSVLGPDHADVGNTLMNLAMIMLNLLDAPGAETCFRESLEIASRNLGRDHNNCAGITFGLARALAAQSKFKDALAFAEESKANNERAFPASPVERVNPNLMPMLTILRAAVAEQKSFEDTFKEFDDVMADAKKLLEKFE